VVHGRPKTPKNTSFLGVTQPPQGSHSPYILGDTTRPGRVTYVLVWSKSDQRRLRKTLHKQTNKQTDRQTDTTKIMVTWPWTNTVHNEEIIAQKSFPLRHQIQHSGSVWELEMFRVAVHIKLWCHSLLSPFYLPSCFGLSNLSLSCAPCQQAHLLPQWFETAVSSWYIGLKLIAPLMTEYCTIINRI